MMNDKTENETKDIEAEPAFPVSYREAGNHITYLGMSLRDYFACAAMQGDWAEGRDLFISHEENAKTYYEMADAMLKVREE